MTRPREVTLTPAVSRTNAHWFHFGFTSARARALGPPGVVLVYYTLSFSLAIVTDKVRTTYFWTIGFINHNHFRALLKPFEINLKNKLKP